MEYMDQLTIIVSSINAFLWGYLLVFLLCGMGLYYTIRLKFIQIRHFNLGFKALVKGVLHKSEKADKQGMSSFQAVTTAISGQVGTGNLAGPATAIMLGGPGAIFWMWISSFLGMATIYAETILGQQFKTTDKSGQIVGGPAYYIEKGLNSKLLASVFAIFCILALGIAGNMVQANSIVSAFENVIDIPQWILGVILALCAAGVVVGGIRSIATFSERVVPLMALFYLFGALIILFINYQYVLPAFKAIILAAFDPTAVLGGGAGVAIQHAMRFGIARGLFANEAGMGSTPHANAIAKVDLPEQQGFIAMMGVFVVAIIVTITALVIITSGMKAWQLSNINDVNFLRIFDGKEGIAITQQAYHYVFGHMGNVFISISLFFFAFTTMIGWYYYAEVNVRYLFNSIKAVRIYQCCFVCAIILASLFQARFVWELADLFNGLMVLPNLIALLILSPLVLKSGKKEELTKNAVGNES